MNPMQENSDTGTGARNRYIFCLIANLLLLGAIFATFIQKWCEKNIAIAVAKGEDYWIFVHETIDWRFVSLLVLTLSIMSWCVAVRRHENTRLFIVPFVVLLIFHICLQLVAV
ncbi:MAG: hypothetical protein Q4D38_10125 [Planctomycetia bacterium]|nr:hypothetical protein [Planctomycetia bacterium]